MMTKIITLKALGEGRCGAADNGNMNSSCRGEKDLKSIQRLLKKGLVKGEDLFIDSPILRFRLHGSGR